MQNLDQNSGMLKLFGTSLLSSPHPLKLYFSLKEKKGIVGRRESELMRMDTNAVR